MKRELLDFKLLGADEQFNLREVLLRHFDDLNGKLPITGGWGYTKDTSIVIDKNHNDVDDFPPFSLVSWEYKLAELRLFEELIVFRENNDRYSGIEKNLVNQEVIYENDRRYDYLVFEVSCFADKDWEMLKNEYEVNISNPNFDLTAHTLKRESLKYQFTTEYYFDITAAF